LFTPVVDALARRRVPRLVSVSLVYVSLTTIIATLLVWTVPAVYEQGQYVLGQLSKPQTYGFISSATNGVERFLVQHGVPSKDISHFTHDYSVSLKTGAPNAGSQLQKIIRSRLDPSALANSTTSFVAFLSTFQAILINAVLVLILAFYMTLDGHKLMRRALSYLPPSIGEIMTDVNVIINRKFGGYLRGQLILAASYGLLTYIIIAGFGVRDYAVVLATIAAVMMLIPYIGAIAAVAIPMAGYVLAHVMDINFPVGGVVLLFLFLFVAQHIVLNLLAPRVMSSAVGMHPILVILGLLLGTKVAGLWGAVFGVPIFGVLLSTTDLVYRRVMGNRYGFHPPLAKRPNNKRDSGAAFHQPGDAANTGREEGLGESTLHGEAQRGMVLPPDLEKLLRSLSQRHDGSPDP
jgi:predicted PurR-regulated permease PerM